MTGRIAARLVELDIALPKQSAAQANYVPFVRSGPLVFISGQITLNAGRIDYVGKIGKEFNTEEGKRAARLAALSVVSQIASALGGDLDRVKRIVKVTGYVNATPEFTQHPEVVNGASDLFVEIFGDAGQHARAAVGCSSLPRGVAVEIEAIFEVE